MKVFEPPSRTAAASTVLLGINRRGSWVVREKNGLYGGLFVTRAHALKYALSENGHHREAIVEVSRGIELDIPVHRRDERGRLSGTPTQAGAVELLTFWGALGQNGLVNSRGDRHVSIRFGWCNFHNKMILSPADPVATW
ncbi:hypothetical protein [Bradyrhizobium sp. Tv2a-2]|uniref:hypothetical protein n=1 Tax=Bradyrhizobium sp. Tv2a-2 TaxID=113395 RepID=UPI0032DFC2B1